MGGKRSILRGLVAAVVVLATMAVPAVGAGADPDVTPPDTVIDLGPPSSQQSLTQVVTFHGEPAADADHFECQILGVTEVGGFAPCTSPFTRTVSDHTPDFHSTDGTSWTISVRAIDAAGNVDPTPATVSFTLDLHTPDGFFTSVPPSPSNDSTPTFAFTLVRANGAGCQIDAGAVQNCSTPYTTPALADGTHTITLVAVMTPDPNGDPSPATYTWTVDTTPPDTNIVGGPTGMTSEQTSMFDLTSTDPGATFVCTLDGHELAAPSADPLTIQLTDAAHTLRVVAVDAAGNEDPTPAVSTWTVDSGDDTAPDTVLDSAPAGGYAQSLTPVFEFHGVPGTDTAGFECGLIYNNAPWGSTGPCTSPYVPPLPDHFPTMPSSVDGSVWTLHVAAVDVAGNVDPTPVTTTFTLDLHSPDATFTSGPSDPSNDSTPTFTFDVVRTHDIACVIDGGPRVDCGSPYTTPTLADGTHTLTLYLSNIPTPYSDPTPATYTWRVDANPLPDITTQPQDQHVAYGQGATFSVAAIDATSVAWSRQAPGGGTWTPIAGATTSTLMLQPSVVESGAHYRATATNANGRVTSNAVLLTVDRAALQVSVSHANVVYGTALTGPNGFSPQVQGFVNGETSAVLTSPPTCGVGSTTPAVGSYAITCSGATAANYSFTYGAASMAVTPATLTITANNASRPFGAANPALTASYTGLVNGDTPATALSHPPVCTTTATPTSPVVPQGYPITCSVAGIAAPNYVLVTQPGTLTITKATTTFTHQPTHHGGLLGLTSHTYSSRLTRAYDGAPLSGKTVTLRLSGVTLCTTTTNANGVASCTVGGLVLGQPTLTATWSGDTGYAGATTTGTVN